MSCNNPFPTMDVCIVFCGVYFEAILHVLIRQIARQVQEP